MIYFSKRLGLFLIPAFVYLIIAIYIDPYNIIHKCNNPRLTELKSDISLKLNYPLYKLQDYSENPSDAVLLGDSRTAQLKALEFKNIGQMRIANLAYGGASLADIIETFWYITKIHPVKQVYVGVNFNLYNDFNNGNRVIEAVKLKESPFSYILSKYCLKSTYYILNAIVTGKVVNIETPNLNKDEFWKYQLESSAAINYRNYRYPSSYHESLIEISDYCKEKDIKLIFFIPPTHVDLQQKVCDFKLEQEEIEFKADLANLGIMFDFDYPNPLTRNYNNFRDPYHFNDSIGKIIVNEILTNEVEYARTTTSSQ